jgi:hypothetical protein
MDATTRKRRDALPAPSLRGMLLVLLLLSAGAGALAVQWFGWGWLCELERRRNPEFQAGMVFTAADRECSSRLSRRALAYPLAVTSVAAVAAAVLLMRFRARWWWVLGNLSIVAVWVLAVWRALRLIPLFLE